MKNKTYAGAIVISIVALAAIAFVIPSREYPDVQLAEAITIEGPVHEEVREFATTTLEKIMIVPGKKEQAIAIRKTIAKKETGGVKDCHNAIGQLGERGCYQFRPSTWELYSKEIYGYVATQTPARAEYVTQEKAYRWLKDGLTPRQIFLIWQQGNTEPCRKGVNKGVPYNSCAYVAEALEIYKGLLN